MDSQCHTHVGQVLKSKYQAQIFQKNACQKTKIGNVF